MNGMKRLLTLVTALVILALPAAMAEEVETCTLVVADPSAYLNGVAVGDLEGLRLEGSLIETGAGDGVMLLMRLLGGDEEAARAYASFDGRRLIWGADGLSNTYSLPLEKMGIDTSSAEIDALAELFAEETLEQILGVVEGAGEDCIESVLATRDDLGVRRVEHAKGEIEMEGVAYTVATEALQTLVDEIGAGLEAIPAVKQLMDMGAISMSAMPYGDDYNLEKGMEMADDLSEFLSDITVTLWTSVGERAVRVETDFEMANLLGGGETLTSDMYYDLYIDEDGAVRIAGFGRSLLDEELYGEMTAEGTVRLKSDCPFIELRETINMKIDGAWRPAIDTAVYLYPQGSTENNPDRVLFGFDQSIEDETSGAVSNRMEGYYAPADGKNYLYDETYVYLYEGNAENQQQIDALVQTRHEDGQEYYGAQLSIKDASSSVSLYYTFEGEYAQNAFGGEDHSGKLALGAAMDGMSVEAAANISLTHATCEESALPDLSGTAVNMLAMGEKEEDQLASELEILGRKVQSVLTGTVPALAGLLASGML